MTLIDCYISLIEEAFEQAEKKPIRIIDKMLQYLLQKSQKTHLGYYPHYFFIIKLRRKIETEDLNIESVLTEFNVYQQISGAFGIKKNHDLAAILTAFLSFYSHYEKLLNPELLSNLPARSSLLFRYVCIPDTTQPLDYSESNLLQKLLPLIPSMKLIEAKKNVIQQITSTALTLPAEVNAATEKLDHEAKQIFTQPNEKVSLLLQNIKNAPECKKTRLEFCTYLMRADHFVPVAQQEEVGSYLHGWWEKPFPRLVLKVRRHLDIQVQHHTTLKRLCGEYKDTRYDTAQYLRDSDLQCNTEIAVTLLRLLSTGLMIHQARSSTVVYIRDAATEIEEKAIPLQENFSPLEAKLFVLTKQNSDDRWHFDRGRIVCLMLGQLSPYIAKDKLAAVLVALKVRLQDEDTHISLALTICHSVAVLAPLVPNSSISSTLIDPVVKILHRGDIASRNAFKQLMLTQEMDIQIYYTYGVIGKKIKELLPNNKSEKIELQILFVDMIVMMQNQRPKLQKINSPPESKDDIRTILSLT